MGKTTEECGGEEGALPLAELDLLLPGAAGARHALAFAALTLGATALALALRGRFLLRSWALLNLEPTGANAWLGDLATLIRAEGLWLLPLLVVTCLARYLAVPLLARGLAAAALGGRLLMVGTGPAGLVLALYGLPVVLAGAAGHWMRRRGVPVEVSVSRELVALSLLVMVHSTLFVLLGAEPIPHCCLVSSVG